MLRNITLAIIILISAGFFQKTFAHPFHVSVAEMNYNPEKQTLEVALKLFTDDLENALTSNFGNQKWNLATTGQLPKIDEYVRKYLITKFIVKQKSKALPLNWIGAEYNMDAVWCYFEIRDFNGTLPFYWTNTVFFELFTDQKNIGHFYINDEATTVYTHQNNKTKKLKIQ